MLAKCSGPIAAFGWRQLEQQSFVAAKARLVLDSDPLRWQRGPPLELPVLEALKDFGVAQGGGRAGKELQAVRAKVAFDRLAWIGRLGLPRVKLALLAASSGRTAEQPLMCTTMISYRP